MPDGNGTRQPARALGTPLALALCCGFATAGAGLCDEPPDSEDSWVRAELQAVCERLTRSDNPFFGHGLLEEVTAALERAEGAPPEIQVRLRGNRGSHLLLQDRVAEAVDQLQEALAVLDETAQELDPAVEKELRKTVLRVLAVARLQLAEDQNCIARHTPASCILPLAEEGVHREPQEARRAGNLYLELIAVAPDEVRSVQARWLLNLSRMLSGDYPDGVPEPLRLPPDAFASDEPFPRFPNIAPGLGIDAMDLAGGAVMEDFDGDGLLDLVSGTWDPCAPMKAFKNDGRGGFVDVTAEWGLDVQLGAFNLVSGDFDGDGMVDLLALRGGWLGADGKIRNSLLRNDLDREAGRFVDVTAAAGLAYPAYPTQTASWADYDGDGDLDLYVGNETPETETVQPWTLSRKSRDAYPSQLFRNDGDGTFTEVARQAGVTNDRFAKGVAWGDYDDDGDPDLYVSNIGPNRLYRNDGRGEDGTTTFTDVAPELGVDEPAEESFATWFFDADNDGDLDLWVNRYGALVEQVSASYMGHEEPGGNPVLYRNDGGRF
ncbi:MAG: FG-GAP repeat domain-containing protein, partial [Thermoanaerobaculia bacterium]